jgi:DNA-binding transcriptional LysR family regulator
VQPFEDDADARAWVTYTEEQAHYEPARWVQRQIEQTREPVALRASSMLMHLEAIRAGTGRGVLPCYVGDGHPLLERLTPPIREIDAEYWIIVHRDLRRAACLSRRRGQVRRAAPGVIDRASGAHLNGWFCAHTRPSAYLSAQ